MVKGENKGKSKEDNPKKTPGEKKHKEADPDKVPGEKKVKDVDANKAQGEKKVKEKSNKVQPSGKSGSNHDNRKSGPRQSMHVTENATPGEKTDHKKTSKSHEEHIIEAPPSTPTAKSESFKYLGLEPDWNSEEIQSHQLLSDGFTCCVVLVMEDSAELTTMGHYLHHAVKTGVRKTFVSVNGEDIAAKAKRFMTSSKIREAGTNDQAYWERMDIWAEAVKHKLISLKQAVTTELTAGNKRKEIELTGARSKEFVQHIQPLAFKTTPLPSEMHGEDENDGIREPPPVPPPTESTNEKSKEHEGHESHKKKKGRKLDTEKSKHSNEEGESSGSSGALSIKSRSSNMRKRGELPMPTLEEVDDSPPKGPHTYVLLQGFYNPKIIEELLKIGVVVDGILLMTDEKVDKRNFSVMDIEDSIPGTFRPRNILPNYLKYAEKQSTLPRDQRDEVGQFWAGLAEMYNAAPADSPLLDCALMNFILPKPEYPLESSPEARGIYASKLFDEAAQRIYEMLVLSDWFHDYTATSTVKQIQPVEEELPHTTYDDLINQVPAECVTIPIIMECLLEQVIVNVEKVPPPKLSEEDELSAHKKQEEQSSEYKKFGKPDWGNSVVPGGLTALAKRNSDSNTSNRNFKPLGPTYSPPLYIKNGDYASIRACHLNEMVASHIASTQVAGDMRNVQGLLWQNLPEFNQGLYMKLLGNLNHFMYFLPPDSIRFEDMFFILHLLMSAGVEVHLQKQAEESQNRASRASTLGALQEKDSFSAKVHTTTTELFSSHTKSQENQNIDGTKLDKDHNYLAINEPAGVHFIMTPNSNHDLSIAPIGHSKDKDNKVKSVNVLEQTTANNEGQDLEGLETQKIDIPAKKLHYQDASLTQLEEPEVAKEKRKSVKYDSGQETGISSKRKSLVEDEQSKRRSSDRTSTNVTENLTQAAGIAADKAMEAAAEIALGTTATTQPFSELQDEEEMNIDEEEETDDMGQSSGDNQPIQSSYYFGTEKQKKSKRFIACEEEWFKDLKEYSVFQSLLECPALLAVSENGALDLSQWIDNYLLSTGMSQGAGDGFLIGNVKDWNHVEELVPVQMIQLLNESVNSYLSMQRMYCPFYDTLLFIFNNPIPKALKSESQYYHKLKTLPGLQHFLEYTINDDDVLQWLMGMERSKGAEIIDSLSVTTLMRIVPEEQWLLVPSIKYMLFKEQAKLIESNIQSAAILKDMDLTEVEVTAVSDKRNSVTEDEIEIEATTEGQITEIDVSKPRRKSRNSTTEEDSKHKEGIKEPRKSKPEIDPGKERRDSKGSGDGDHEAKKSRGRRKSEEKERKKKGIKKGSKMEIIDELPVNSGSGQLGETYLDAIPSFHFTDDSFAKKINQPPDLAAKSAKSKVKAHFDFYDLGKRIVVAAADTYHLFPMDGTIIQYDISTIEPKFRMMQLAITKNGHQTFFYPYYIPHDLDLSTESYVVCPYFHMVHANGTMFAFQDLRAAESAPYMKVSMKRRPETTNLFSYEKVVFGNEAESRRKQSGHEGEEGQPKSPRASQHEDKDNNLLDPTGYPNEEEGEGSDEEEGEEEGEEISKEPETEKSKKGKKGKGKKEKEKSKDLKEKDKDQVSDIKSKDDKPKKGKKDKRKKKDVLKSTSDVSDGDEENHLDEEHEGEGMPSSPAYNKKRDTLNSNNGTGLNPEWVYSESELSEDEGPTGKKKRHSFYAPNWNNAELIIEPMTHTLKVTLPSGLLIQVDDVPGVPLTREVKQSYYAIGSATSRVEASRYYTMNGSVVKFMLNGTIQILTARGVTTNIRELATSSQRGTEDLHKAFATASNVRVFNGEVILPNGDFWDIVNGKKEPHEPLYVFTSGPLPNGEIFRRRQDGVIYLHRHDGTTITHYPDGTRFTTRMIILKDPVEEFEDWVFVGIKYMIEHTNYSTVIFNSLSGNLHIRLPHGDWTRVFADGSIKLSTTDKYAMDVDKQRAILSFPPCSAGTSDIPNLTAVKLWHSIKLAPPNPTPVVPPSRVSTEGLKPKPLPTDSSPAAELESQDKSAKEQPPVESQSTLEDSEKNSITRNSNAKIKPSKSISDTKKTRGAAGAKQKKKSLRNNAKSQNKVKNSAAAVKKKSLVAETLDGESLVEEEEATLDIMKGEDEEEETPTLNEPIKEDEIDVDEKLEIPVDHKLNIDEELSKHSKKFEIQGFLQFTDGSLLCKAIDSWDNRFAVDMYGETFVDKSKEFDDKVEMSTEELIKTLSDHCQLPQEYVSGILRITSSEDLATSVKRINALKQSRIDSCGKLPSTKIFVLKRDMSGYEYLKQMQVETLMSKAKGCRDSMVIVDPLPNRDPRKYITIMQPVTEIDKPRGMWTSPYREPMFRPRILTNKHLQIAKPDDLRWFGYVLMGAHEKRPKFLPNPKEQYLHNKVLKATNKKSSHHAKNSVAQADISGNGTVGEELGENDLDKEHESLIDEAQLEKKRKSKEFKAKPKPDKKAKKDHPPKEQEVEDKPLRKRKSLSKKHGKKKDSLTADNIDATVSSPVQDTFVIEDELHGDGELQHGPPIRLDETEIGEYPDDVPDVQGIYDDEEQINIKAQQHADICTEKKAIVVRSFVEIPQIDEKLQRALLAASVSYGQTVRTQVELFEANKVQDPRTDEEKEHQTLIKQQLIEQNLSDMHLLEQKSGSVIRFHF